MFQFLACVFKLHNPSRHKREVMDFALAEYTRGYAQVLNAASVTLLREQGEYISRSGKAQYTGKSIASLLTYPATVELHSSAKDSLLQDVAGNLASYLELEKSGAKVGYPVARNPSPTANEDALEYFIHAGIGKDDFEQSQARYLAVVRGSVMPLYFCRADAASQTRTGGARNRNFSLLWNTKKRQLLAVIYLLPQGHTMGKPLQATQDNLVRLDTGEIFKSNSKSAILVPLEMGRNGWQEARFLEPAMQSDTTIQTAYLVRNDDTDEYFLHVAFKMKCLPQYEPQAYLGIDKGILFTAAYAVVDLDGGLIELGHIDDQLRELQIKHGREREHLARNGKKVTRRYYKRKAYENILHGLANCLITMAREYQATIVVEDLNIQVRGSRVVSRFRKLDKILQYKCRLAGVPFRSVFAAYSSMICHRCGALMERDDRLVTCECGYQGHSDDNAAVNIARRALYRKKDWAGGYREFHRSFANTSTFETE